MKYIDSGARDPQHALGQWLGELVPSEVTEFRFQSGFYRASGLSLLEPILLELRASKGICTGLVGSNDSGTVGAEVAALASLMGIGRPGAQLGVVAYANAYFHPKVFHVRRSDDSQAAYVGSANLTGSGVHSLHVEAGMLLDTRHGDDDKALDDIAAAMDAWFTLPRAGLFTVSSLADVKDLVANTVLRDAPPPPKASGSSKAAGAKGSGVKLTTLSPLIPIPTAGTKTAAGGGKSGSAPPGGGAGNPAVPPTTPSPVGWDLVWRSRALVRRDLTIPRGTNTNPTGSMLMKKGDWQGIDQRHYFRDDVFQDLDWQGDPPGGHHEIADADVELVVHGQSLGWYNLQIRHNSDTTSKSYAQKNSMTHLRWGNARPHIAQEGLLGCRLLLYRESGGAIPPRFKIEIEDI